MTIPNELYIDEKHSAKLTKILAKQPNLTDEEADKIIINFYTKYGKPEGSF